MLPTSNPARATAAHALGGAAIAAGVIGAYAGSAPVLGPFWAVVSVSALMAAIAAMLRYRRLRRVRPRPAGKGRGDETGLQDLLDALPDRAILLDSRGVVRRYNEAAGGAFGLRAPGGPVAFAIRVPSVLEAVRAVAGGAPPRVVEFADRVPVERWTEAHIVPVAAGDGGPSLVLMVLKDLTAMRQAERMRVDFVANASHELRTPLASLLGFIETLQGPAKGDVAARTRFLEIMRTQANRMSRLLDDLLSLSRIEQKQHLRPDTPVDVGLITRSVLDALGPLAAERKVELRLAAPGEALLVLGDRDELFRVIENLVENAIKYGQDGGAVDVALSSVPADGRGEEVRLAVRDRGPGIPREHLPRLTERFYRVDAGQSRDKGGTGLGLAIVKHILARHRGRLVIESEHGEGATFIAVLDRDMAPAAISGHRSVTHQS